MATFKTIFLLVMVAVAVQAMECEEEITTFSGEQYESNLAVTKLRSIWKKIRSTAQISPVVEPGIFSWFNLLSTSFLSQAFLNNGDVMASDRQKVIHNQGTAVTIKFTSKTTKYSGIFSEGAPYGILRLSLASKPSEGKFIPGIAIKFFRNQMPSVNIMAMPSLDGQSSPNLLLNRFTNVLPPAQMSAANYVLECRFASTIAELGQKDPNPRALPLKHLSETDVNGSIFFLTTTPYQIIFEPTEDARKLMANMQANEDFRMFLDGMGKDIILFEVFARETADADKTYVGYIETLTSFCASTFGDTLYFKHPLDS